MNKNRVSEKLPLFQSLKCTTERILSQYSHDVWSVHGGLQSLISSLDAIFQHGVKPQKGLIGVVVDYWLFVRGLRWLDPTLASDIDSLSKLPAASPVKPQKPKSGFANEKQCSQLTHGEQWIEKSLKDKNISRQIVILLSDSNHLKDHYFDWAFLMDSFFTSAALVCISALEQNSPALLGSLPQSLFTKRLSSQGNLRLHQAFTAASGDIDQENACRNEKNAENGVLNKSSDTLSSNNDPLNVTIKPRELTSTKNQTFKEHSSSLSSESGDVYKSKALINADVSTSSRLNSTNPPPSREFDSARETSLHKSIRKPLFDSSDDDNCDADNFGFLSMTSTSKVSNASVADTYYSIVHIQPDIEDTSSMFTSCTEGAYESDNNRDVAVLLPDLVISAQKSRSNRMVEQDARDSKHSILVEPLENLTTKSSVSSNESFLVEPPKNLTKSLASSSKIVKSRPVTHHRRCKSDWSHEIKKFNDIVPDGPASVGDISGFPKHSQHHATSFAFDNTSSPSEPTSPVSLSRSTSLISYLKNQDLTTCADIVKENAHFDFSEMLIGTIEQIKCHLREGRSRKKSEKSPEDELEDSAHQPPSLGYQSPVGSVISSEMLSTPSFQSGLPIESDGASVVSSSELTSKRSTFSENSTRAESTRTAESIAIGLLHAFSDLRRVTASEFNWLISEEDVPQKLLPIPKSTVVDPDFSDDSGIRLRGNQEWAPPRPQIIFKAPTKLKLKRAMEKQNNRCAGCGTYVEKEFMKRFRYCEYTGKYFCTCCHDNKLSVLPANILERFDFTKCKMSNFSHDLLQKISTSPLFNIDDINPALYKKAKVLATIRDHRFRMISLYIYIQQCRLVDTESDKNGLKPTIVSLLPFHMLDEPVGLYSLKDLERAKTGELLDDLKLGIELTSSHVQSCELCRSKGFVCELCQSNEIIFPHQTSCLTCVFCKACFHKKCFNAANCPKCARLRRRREALEEISEEETADSND